MKLLGFLLLGVFSFFFVELFSVYYATSVGAGFSEIVDSQHLIGQFS